jgi:serine/threonine-protein kinase
MVALSPAAAAEASIEPATRQVRDRYHSLFVIGEGGMGRVEAALERGEAGFERVVALKRLLPKGPRDARHVEMFLREARIATQIRHPNVVHAFAFGEVEGELFLAMQYVAGEPLSRVLAVGRGRGSGLAPASAAWVLAEACEGLHAAHELCDADGKLLRVVHRDVSPHNVMVSYDGGVKVVDFGIARFDSAGPATRTGEVKGKLAYMSPEQALGEALDRRSDIFSMGAVLFECLTGQPMWGEGTDVQLMRRIALEPPPRVDALVRGVPAALVDLQARMVARDPAARPGTARDAALQLRAFADAAGEPNPRRAVAATMTALFADDARRRRDRLALALQELSLPNAAALRTELEPAEVPTPVPEPMPPRRWIVRAAVASIAVGVGAFAAVSTRHPSTPVPKEIDRSVQTAEASPAPPAPVPASPAPTTPEAVGSSLAPEASVVKPTPKSAPRLVRPASSAKPTSPKLPNVDPSPF